MKGWAAMDKNRQILKIKNKKVDGRANIFISWQERTSAEKSWDDYTLRCDEMARPEFYKALEALKEHVTQICELPDEYEGRMTPSGVSFSYDKDGGNIWGAVITAQMKLDYNPAPLNIVTPYKSNAVPENCDEDYALSLECQMALKILETEAHISMATARKAVYLMMIRAKMKARKRARARKRRENRQHENAIAV